MSLIIARTFVAANRDNFRISASNIRMQKISLFLWLAPKALVKAMKRYIVESVEC